MLFPRDKLSSLFLINNCGVQLLNEIWMYEIKNDVWYFVKPHIESLEKQKSQAIPQARMYHSALYIQREDFNLRQEKRILRKFMYVYGGFSIYCQNACGDFWQFEIAYAPQRYYPNNNAQDWNRGNRWTQIYPSSNVSPGKRFRHCAVAVEDYKTIFLFGGIEIVQTETGTKYEFKNDLFSYDVFSNRWTRKFALGIKKQFRSVRINLIYDYLLGWNERKNFNSSKRN